MAQTIKQTMDFVSKSNNLMSFDRSFAVLNGQPIDAESIFDSKTAAEAYATKATAYVGKIIVVVESEVVTAYVIDTGGSLKPIGDNIFTSTEKATQYAQKSIVPIGTILVVDEFVGKEPDKKEVVTAYVIDSDRSLKPIGDKATMDKIAAAVAELQATMPTKASKAEAIGSISQEGNSKDRFSYASVDGKTIENTIIIDNVAEATKATDVNLSAEGTNTATIKIKAGTGTPASFTVNDVAHATRATADNNGNTITSTYATKAELNDGLSGKADNNTVTDLSNRVDENKDGIARLDEYFTNGIANKATADANGKDIAATYETKENVTSGLAGKLGLHAKADNSAKLEGKTQAEVIEEARKGYATTGYVDNKVAGSVQYLGLAKALTDLDVNAGKGDFYRASADFAGVSSGDLIVSLKDEKKTQTIDEVNFAVVKSSDDYKGTVKSVTAGGGLTGGKITEFGTIAHAAGNAVSKAEGFYKISTDAYSHVNSVKEVGTEDITGALGYTPYNATNPNGYTDNKGTVTSVTVTGSNGLTGTGTVTSSGPIILSHADTSSQASSKNTERTFIQSVELDEYGHVTKLETNTATDTNTWRNININNSQWKSTDINSGAINFKNGSNVTIKGSGSDIIINAVDKDTKNTAGATNTTTTGQLFIVGATEQTENPQTYTEANAYIQAGAVYSEGKKVLTSHQSLANYATQNWVTDTATAHNAGLLNGFDGTHYLDYNNFTNIPFNAKGVTWDTGGDSLSGGFCLYPAQEGMDAQKGLVFAEEGAGPEGELNGVYYINLANDVTQERTLSDYELIVKQDLNNVIFQNGTNLTTQGGIAICLNGGSASDWK